MRSARDAPLATGQPDVEGRVAISANPGGGVSGTVGVGYHVGKPRYFLTQSGAP